MWQIPDLEWARLDCVNTGARKYVAADHIIYVIIKPYQCYHYYYKDHFQTQVFGLNEAKAKANKWNRMIKSWKITIRY